MTMSRVNNKFFICLIALMLSVTSCLEKYPDSAIPEDQAITNINEANQFVLGIYADFKSSSLYSGLLTLLPDVQCDLVYAVEGFSNVYGDVWRWDIKQTHLRSHLYGLVYIQ